MVCDHHDLSCGAENAPNILKYSSKHALGQPIKIVIVEVRSIIEGNAILIL